MSNVLRLEGLTKSFGKRVAVKDLSLNVHEGDCYGFLGPNGAGKTTTLRMILDLVHPTSGTIEVMGTTVGLERRRHIGAVVEHAGFHDKISGRANLEILAAYDGSVDIAAIDEAVSIVGLEDRQWDAFGTYSMGMRQRLGIAQALMRKPKLLLLDEPTNGLDPAGMRAIRDLITRLRHEVGMTIFISSHLMSEIQQLCNRVGILNLGTLIAEGEVNKLLAEQAGRHFRVSGAAGEQLATIARRVPWLEFLGHQIHSAELAVEAGRKPSEIHAVFEEAGLSGIQIEEIDANLESLFIRLTGTGGQIE